MLLRFRLLAAGWSPAAFLLGLRLSRDQPTWTIVLAVAGGVSIVSVVLLLRARSSLNAQPYVLRVVEDQSGEVAGYLLTFVFPFVFVDFSTWREVTAWVVFAALAAALVVRSDLHLLSPVLLVAGYRVYRVETNSGLATTMLSPFPLRVNNTVDAAALSGGALKVTAKRVEA